MPDEIRVPIVEEQATVTKRLGGTERVSVHTTTNEHQVTVADEIRRESVAVTRVPIDREVAEAPPIRTEADVTIVPVLEERLVVEKRLFVVEELHLRRTTSLEPVEIPATLRRTAVHVDRERTDQQEDI